MYLTKRIVGMLTLCALFCGFRLWAHEADAMEILQQQQLLNSYADELARQQAELEPVYANIWELLAVWLRLGFLHIIPRGLDHILFVLGLFLLNRHWKPLLWQVSAFTLAHTITLGLSMYDIVNLPGNVVEPLIALSICYVAVENMVTNELKPWRPLVVFIFGLIHGLGFAGVLSELRLPDGDYLSALLAFNVGVEVGQLAVIGLAFVALRWFYDRPWYRKGIVMPLSLLIAGCGAFWTVTRIFA